MSEDGLPYPPYPFSDDDDDKSLLGGILGKSGQLINYKGRERPFGNSGDDILDLSFIFYYLVLYNVAIYTRLTEADGGDKNDIDASREPKNGGARGTLWTRRWPNRPSVNVRMKLAN